MGSKNNPGAFDCYENAHADEPLFVLMKRDKHAPALVKLWADLREAEDENLAKVAEARTCAFAMQELMANAHQDTARCSANDNVDAPKDDGCICHGNWRALVAKTTPFLGKRFRDQNGDHHTFFGLVHGADDYYYGMWDTAGKVRLLSCVGDLAGWGFVLEEDCYVDPSPKGDLTSRAVMSLLRFFTFFAFIPSLCAPCQAGCWRIGATTAVIQRYAGSNLWQLAFWRDRVGWFDE